MLDYIQIHGALFVLIFLLGCQLSQQLVQNKQVPVYYINMESKPERKVYMESHLREAGFNYVKRISALTPRSCNLLMLESSCNRRVGYHEIAIVCSHLSALYTAILLDDSKQAKSSKYALILEDDVRFIYDIDFEELISKAPPDFTMIQLMMSHTDHFIECWRTYIEYLRFSKFINEADGLFTPRLRNSTVWSAQAYLVRKDALRVFISNAVRHDRNGNLGFVIAGTFDYNKPNSLNNPYKPVIASQCIFSDMFLYSAGQPAYILNVPLLNGAGHGMNSSSHQAHVPFHVHGFAAIERAQQSFTEGIVPLPSFAKKYSKQAFSTPSFNWSALAEVTEQPVFPKTKPKRYQDFSVT